MKAKVHAIVAMFAIFLISASLISTLIFALFVDSPSAIVSLKSIIFRGTFPLVLALLILGASGMSLLGKRTDSLALTKQKRGPIGFMTSLLVLLPSAYFLARWSAAGSFGTLYFIIQGVSIIASFVVFAMVALNIRDGLKLTGKIASGPKNAGAYIDERDDGPLIAASIPKLIDKDGSELTAKPVAALCRCGASKNKPYCDGSHTAIGFTSKPSDDRTKDQVLTYEGSEVTVHYNRLLCSHAAECGKRNKAAFDSSRKPWIIPDNASKDEVLEIVKACPSGALRYSFAGDKEPTHILPDAPNVTIEKDGPYRVAGVKLNTERLATGACPDKYVLCRCGASKNKPYCDGSHVDIKFNDES